MSENENNVEKNGLITIIENAVQLPGVKVNRDAFLVSVFDKKTPEIKDIILRYGPVEAGITREELKRKATALVQDRTLKSTGMSFAAGLPGGLAMAATIPADTLQFFGIALRLSQEIAYLYGEDDLWSDGNLDQEKVTNTLIVYYGVMLGASGASATLRVLASALGKQALKKIPQMALTKTFYYPIIKSVVRFFGGKMTKDTFGKLVSKAIPVIGGVVSGGITYISLKPMGMRLVNTLDEAKFDYTKEELDRDLKEIEAEVQKQEKAEVEAKQVAQKSIAEEIKKNKELLDQGVITEEEFEVIKKKLIDNM